MSRLAVVRAGMLTTVQDSGRTSLRRYGVVAGGPMDTFAARVANLLVGNDRGAALLECTIAGPALRLEDDRVIAITGHAPRARLDDMPVRAWTTVTAPAGSTLSVPDTGPGCRAFVAIAGGITVEAVLGSRATDIAAGIGGMHGRALQVGDMLPLGTSSARPPAQAFGGAAVVGRSMMPDYAAEPLIRILRGPETERTGDAAWQTLLGSSFTVTAASNRMGCRLDGPPLTSADPAEMISSPVSVGTIQLPPSGQPIVLTSDAQTIGGYPRIAHVISVDLPVIAQVRPGATVRFAESTLRHAHDLLAARERDLRMLADALRLRA
jgi:antagonist of KipI